MLQNKGIEPETCLDELNLTNPGVVADIHRQYIEAGAQYHPDQHLWRKPV